jgi:hypothetical protein
LIDVGSFSIYKYKVDRNTIDSTNTTQVEKLKEYIVGLTQIIKTAKDDVETYITTMTGDDNIKYETLYRQKVLLMPQAPLISTPIKDGYRKNLSSNFHIHRIPNTKKISIDLRGDVYTIMKSSGGKRKSSIKRLRRTPRRSRGGMDVPQTPLIRRYSIFSDSDSEGITTDQENLKQGSKQIKTPIDAVEQRFNPIKTRTDALNDFNKFIDDIREKTFKFAEGSDNISSDSNDPFLTIIPFIEDKYGSTDTFINLVKQNRYEITNEDETKWASQFVVKEEESEEPSAKRSKKTYYIEDYDEEFMEELEEAIKNLETEPIDTEIIELFKTIEVVDVPKVGSNRKRKTYRRKRLF